MAQTEIEPNCKLSLGSSSRCEGNTTKPVPGESNVIEYWYRLYSGTETGSSFKSRILPRTMKTSSISCRTNRFSGMFSETASSSHEEFFGGNRKDTTESFVPAQLGCLDSHIPSGKLSLNRTMVRGIHASTISDLRSGRGARVSALDHLDRRIRVHHLNRESA